MTTVEVNEGTIFATQMGIDWWLLFREIGERAGRIRRSGASPMGELCSVACDDREHAGWLVNRMIEQGIPKSALKIPRSRRATSGRAIPEPTEGQNRG